MKEIRARTTHEAFVEKVLGHTHAHRQRERDGESWSAQRNRSRGVAGRRLFLREEVCLNFFFLVFSPNVHPLCQKRQFFRKREKKNVVNDEDDTQKKSFFDDTARVLREEPGRGGSRAFARVRICG